MPYVCGHVLKSALPFGDIEVCVTEPCIAIVSRAAPRALGHVVVKMHIDLLLCELSSNVIVHLMGSDTVPYGD